MHRRSRGAGAGIGVIQPVILRLLKLFLGQIQSQPVVIGLEIPQADGDVFAAHAQEGADIDDNLSNLPVPVELVSIRPLVLLAASPLANVTFVPLTSIEIGAVLFAIRRE